MSTPEIPSGEIDGAAPDGGENERIVWWPAIAAPPGFHERFLEHIVRVGFDSCLIPGEEEKAPRVGGNPRVPAMGLKWIIHERGIIVCL